MAVRALKPLSIPPIEVAASPKQPLGMTAAAFMRDYWQKRPLLIRGGFIDFSPNLAPEDLAGLACEEFALSRLVLRDPKRDRWTLRTGPFDESDFTSLPRSHWTVLVQDVDKWDADVAALLDRFTFLPRWRIDDVMVSYAADGGGVGAHVDQYDVFLVQGTGQRRWRINTDPSAPTEFRDDAELKLLRTFTPSHDWLLEPGDALYLPPGVPHDGIAIGACLTFSIGMRAPSQAELMLDFVEALAEPLGEQHRYVDPDLDPTRDAGEIDAAALRRVSAALAALRDTDPALLQQWFGRFITNYRCAQVASPPRKPLDCTALEHALCNGGVLLPHPWTRFAWVRGRGGATLFAAGRAYATSLSLARRTSTHQPIRAGDVCGRRNLRATLALVNDGHLVLQRPRKRP